MHSAGERPDGRAGSDPARDRRNLGGPRQRRRRPADGGRPRPRRGPARRSALHAAAGLARPGDGGALLLRAGERRTVAALPRRVSAPGVPPQGLGELSRARTRRSPRPCWRRPADGPALVFIQDYHFGLLPRMLKERQSEPDDRAVLAHSVAQPRDFPRRFRGRRNCWTACSATICSGFHLQYHCANFLDTVDRGVEAKVDHGALRRHAAGRRDAGSAFPDQHRFRSARAGGCAARVVDRHMERWRSELGRGRPRSSASASTARTTPRAFRTG